jgi:WD40 repeat protein
MFSHATNVCLLFLLWSASPAAAPDQNGWQTPPPTRTVGPYYYERALSPAELEGRPLRELILMRSTIAARAGRVFRPKWLRQYFAQQPWYRPTGFVDARLTGVDRKNDETLARVLAALGPPEFERRLKDFDVRQRAASERAAVVVATSPHDLALSAHADGALRLWDLRRGRYRTLQAAGPLKQAGLVTFSSDGHLAMAMQFAPAQHNAVNSVWDVDTAAFVRRVEIDRRCTNHFVSLPARNIILFECVGQIEAWDWVAGRSVGSFSVGRRDVTAIAVSTDGETLLVIHPNADVSLWKMTAPDKLERLAQFNLTWGSACGAVAPGGERGFVVGPYGDHHENWGVVADRANHWALRYLPRSYFNFPLTAASMATFSPDGTLLLAAGFQGGVGWWDAASGRQIWSRPDRETAVRRISRPQAALTADSTRVLTVGYADTLSLIDAKSGAEKVLRFSPAEPWDGEDEKLEQILLAHARGNVVTGLHLPDEEVALVDDLALFDQLITAEDVASLSRSELRFVRNTIYARRGRPFNAPSIQHWLGGKAWYHPDPSYSDARLTSIDRANLQTVGRAEAKNRGPMTEHQYEKEECPGIEDCP